MAEATVPSSQVRRSQVSFEDNSYKLKLWTIFALIASVGVHAGLFFAFTKLGWGSLSWERTPVAAPEQRISISSELLKSQDIIQQPPPDIQPPDKQALDTKFDNYDLQQMLPDQEIDLTPQVEDVKAFVRSTGPDPSSASALQPVEHNLAPSGEDIANALNSLKQSALREQVSEKQLLLDGPPGEERELGITENLLDEVTDFSAKGAGTGDKVPGFSSLDDILGSGGAMNNHTGPILMPTDLLFGYNSADLGENARLSLMKLGFIIQKNPGKTFTIEGHTDSFGTDEYNNTLSQRRAEAVKVWLVESLLIDANRIRTEGKGKSKPIADTKGTVEQQKLNRRVEIKVR